MKTNQWEIRQSRKSAAQIRADIALARLAYESPPASSRWRELDKLIRRWVKGK